MAWKYVMFNMNDMWELPIIFPDKLVHIEVASAILPTLPVPAKCRLSSAGMIERLYVEAVGRHSETLNISAHPSDEQVINTMGYLHGIGLK